MQCSLDWWPSDFECLGVGRPQESHLPIGAAKGRRRVAAQRLGHSVEGRSASRQSVSQAVCSRPSLTGESRPVEGRLNLSCRLFAPRHVLWAIVRRRLCAGGIFEASAPLDRPCRTLDPLRGCTPANERKKGERTAVHAPWICRNLTARLRV
jgi:hypothetical protein